MELISAHVGSYPRIGGTKELQLHRRTIAQWERKEKTDQDLRAAEDTLTEWALKEQQEAGVGLATDGLIRWYDPISHLAGKLEGTKINGLLRFFDTNCYFRQPVIEGPVKRTGPLVVNEFEFARKNSSLPIKPVLTGPYTLAKLSIINTGASVAGLAEQYAAALADEVEALVKAGAEVIQVDEPALLKAGEEYAVAEAGLKQLAAKKGKARLVLHTYFGDAAPLYDKLQALPVDVLSFDFTYSPKLVDVIASAGSEKALGFGLLDGRNTKLEDVGALVGALRKMAPKVKGSPSYLTLSCGLEFLPRDRAFGKLKLLAAAQSAFSKS